MNSSSSSSSSSSSKKEDHKCMDMENNNNNNNKKLISNCLIALPFFSPPPFLHFSPSSTTTLFKSHSKSNNDNKNLHSLLTMEVSHIVHNFHNSIVSTADRCLGLFQILASRNPFLNKVFSLSADFRNFCQVSGIRQTLVLWILNGISREKGNGHMNKIHRRNYRNLNSLTNHNFAAILPGDSVAGVVVTNGILNFLNIYNTLLVVRLVLTWFPNSPPAIVSPLSTLCDPYLNIFRGIIPPLGGTLDLSPILAFLVLNALTSTASALPAELPSTGGVSQDSSSSSNLTPLTTSQKKWMTRFAANMPKSSKSQS
ncbi:hypothetical protein LguiB_009613 [Lonicera macranthoides]